MTYTPSRTPAITRRKQSAARDPGDGAARGDADQADREQRGDADAADQRGHHDAPERVDVDPVAHTGVPTWVGVPRPTHSSLTFPAWTAVLREAR